MGLGRSVGFSGKSGDFFFPVEKIQFIGYTGLVWTKLKDWLLKEQQLMMSVKYLFKRELAVLVAIIVHNVLPPVVHRKKINKIYIGVAGDMIKVMRYK